MPEAPTVLQCCQIKHRVCRDPSRQGILCCLGRGIRAPMLSACSMYSSKTVDCWNDKDLAGRVCGLINVLYQHMPGRSEGNHVKPQSVWCASRPTFEPCYFRTRSTVLLLRKPFGPHSTDPDITKLLKHGRLYLHENIFQYTRVGTLIVATIYLQLIQNRYMFRSFTVLQCSHQHCVQTVASDVEVVGYL